MAATTKDRFNGMQGGARRRRQSRDRVPLRLAASTPEPAIRAADAQTPRARLRVVAAKIDPWTAVGEAAAELRREFGGRIDLFVFHPESTWRVEMDAAELGQIVKNLGTYLHDEIRKATERTGEGLLCPPCPGAHIVVELENAEMLRGRNRVRATQWVVLTVSANCTGLLDATCHPAQAGFSVDPALRLVRRAAALVQKNHGGFDVSGAAGRRIAFRAYLPCSVPSTRQVADGDRPLWSRAPGGAFRERYDDDCLCGPAKTKTDATKVWLSTAVDWLGARLSNTPIWSRFRAI